MLQASELQPLELNEVSLWNSVLLLNTLVKSSSHQIQLNDDHGSLAVTPVINDAESGQALMMAVVPVNDSKLLPEDEGANEGEGSDTSSQATDKKDDALSHHHHQNQQHHHAKMNNSVVHQHQHQTQAVPLVSYSNSATPNSGCYTINYENGTPGSTTVYATATGAPGMSTTYQTAVSHHIVTPTKPPKNITPRSNSSRTAPSTLYLHPSSIHIRRRWTRRCPATLCPCTTSSATRTWPERRCIRRRRRPTALRRVGPQQYYRLRTHRRRRRRQQRPLTVELRCTRTIRPER